MEEKNITKVEQTVEDMSNNFNKFSNYLKHNTQLRHFMGFGVTLAFIFNVLTLNPFFNLMYIGLFFYSCRETIRYHSLKLSSGDTNPVINLNISYYWIALSCLNVLYYFSNFVSYFFDNFFMTLLINYMYFNLFVYTVHDFGKHFKDPLPRLTYVKKINLFENSDNNVFLNMVNTGVNFYRVNMKVYDNIILTLGPNAFYEYFQIPYDSLYHSTDYGIIFYNKLKVVFNKLQNRFTKNNKVQEVSNNEILEMLNTERERLNPKIEVTNVIETMKTVEEMKKEE